MVDTRFPVSVHIMTVLAHHQPKLVTSDYLADGIKTNPSFIRKLVAALSAAGLIESVRGKMGGARLAKKPSEITLDQIYKAVGDTPLVAVPDKTPKRSCTISCSMHDILGKLSDEIEDTTLRELKKRSLKDLLDQVKKNS